MVSLLLSILSSTLILIIFKIIEKQKLAIFPPIVINYIAASFLGFIINPTASNFNFASISPWILISIIIGFMLIANFYLIGNSTQKVGIGITTIAAKMSFVLPVIYSILFDINDGFDAKKIVLITLALLSVYLVVFPRKLDEQKTLNILYPTLIFFGLGLLDTLVKFCQHHYISTPQNAALFSAINFSVAGIIGIGIAVFTKNNRQSLKMPKVWIIGTALGIANFGSMYFLINALNALKFNNSLVFGINNIGIVLASVIVAILIFKERFTLINWGGLALSLVVLLGMITIFL